MFKKSSISLATAALLLASTGANAFTIQFDYSLDTNGFFADAARKSLMEAAGEYFENRITDDLDAIVSAGSNEFTARVRRPDDGTILNIANYSVSADTIVVYVGGRDLGGSTLGQGGPAGWSASGSSAFFSTIRNRGEIGTTTGGTADEFAPWGGSIAFDIDSNWDFNADLSPGAAISGNDFYSVALHELGHVLGFGTSDSWYAQVSGGEFIGSASIGVHGGDVPLLGDDAHWAEGLMSTIAGGAAQETAMDPTLTVNTRKIFTALDFAALEDIGWEVTPVPLPAAAFPFLAAVLASAAVARRGRRSA